MTLQVRELVPVLFLVSLAACENKQVRDAASSPASAQSAKAWTIPMEVAGTNTPASCATAFSSKANEEAAGIWLTGFWSGLNVARGLVVGSTSDADGILREIKLDCQKTPAAALHQSAHQTYDRMRANRR